MKNLGVKEQMMLSLIFNSPSKGVKEREVPYPECFESLINDGLVKEIGVQGGSKCYVLSMRGIHIVLSMANSGMPVDCGLNDRGYKLVVSMKRTLDDLFVRVRARDPRVFISRDALREINKIRTSMDDFLLNKDDHHVPSVLTSGEEVKE